MSLDKRQFNQILAKLQHYCAYQERCQKEVFDKLQQFEISEELTYQVMFALEEENFLNEKRFVEIYASSKFRLKKWGKNKIKQALLQKKISPRLIQHGLSQISEEAYFQTLLLLLEKKVITLRTTNLLKQQQKLVPYALQKGYESTLIWQAIKIVQAHK